MEVCWLKRLFDADSLKALPRVPFTIAIDEAPTLPITDPIADPYSLKLVARDRKAAPFIYFNFVAFGICLLRGRGDSLPLNLSRVARSEL